MGLAVLTMTGHAERTRSAWPNPLWSLVPAAAGLAFGLVLGIDPLPIAIHALAAAGAWWVGRTLQVDYGNALITGLLYATSPLARAALAPDTAVPIASLAILPVGLLVWRVAGNPVSATGEQAVQRRIAGALAAVGLTACALVTVIAARAFSAPFPSGLVHVAAIGPALLAGQLLAALARPGAARPLRASLASTLTLALMVIGTILAASR